MECSGHLRLHTLICAAVMALSLAPAAHAVVITQHPTSAPAQKLVGWSGGLLATGITPSVLANAITVVPFAVGKGYGNKNDVTAVGVGPNGLPWIVAAAEGLAARASTKSPRRPPRSGLYCQKARRCWRSPLVPMGMFGWRLGAQFCGISREPV